MDIDNPMDGSSEGTTRHDALSSNPSDTTVTQLPKSDSQEPQPSSPRLDSTSTHSSQADSHKPSDTTDHASHDRDRVLASASASASTSVSAAASAADEAEHNDSTSSSGASIGPVSNGSQAQGDVLVAGADDSPEGMDKFLRRVEMEKKIAQLQQRLELASIKTNHGWTDMTIKEIEGRLPVQPPTRQPIVIPNGSGPAYEPPSPSRPWQLADVLWQPLPQPGTPGTPSYSRPAPHLSHHTPSHSLPGGLPSIASLSGHSPRHMSSPSRRVGMDEFMSRPTLSPLRGYSQSQQRPPSSNGHRRAVSSISSLQFLTTDPYPVASSSTSSNTPRPKKTPKKRSQSQSNPRDRPSTQDVDAARALTFMLESGRSPVAPSPDRRRDGPSSASSLTPGSGWPSGGPPTQHFPVHSGNLPSPFSDMPPPRPRAQSFMVHDDRDPNGSFQRPHLPPPPMMHQGPLTPKSHSNSHGRGVSFDGHRSFWRSSPDRSRERDRERDREQRERERMREDEGMDAGDDDKAAAELMMFLAHSPSPVRPKRNSADAPKNFHGTARVLFSDMPPRSGGGGGSGGSGGTMGPPLSVRR